MICAAVRPDDRRRCAVLFALVVGNASGRCARHSASVGGIPGAPLRDAAARPRKHSVRRGPSCRRVSFRPADLRRDAFSVQHRSALDDASPRIFRADPPRAGCEPILARWGDETSSSCGRPSCVGGWPSNRPAAEAALVIPGRHHSARRDRSPTASSRARAGAVLAGGQRWNWPTPARSRAGSSTPSADRPGHRRIRTCVPYCARWRFRHVVLMPSASGLFVILLVALGSFASGAWRSMAASATFRI